MTEAATEGVVKALSYTTGMLMARNLVGEM